MKYSSRFLLLAILLVTAACSSYQSYQTYRREDVADRLANPAWLIQRKISAGAFDLAVAERMHKRFAAADIYIEGNGYSDTDSERDSKDPTPQNPVALHLATRDLAQNVVWMGRPCQYQASQTYAGIKESRPCSERYWKESRFSPEVIEAYNIALNEIKARYDLKGFHLIGFDGGGAIATLLAAQRTDVLSLRTVAGILDTNAYSRLHGLPKLEGANPLSVAAQLATLPQAHWTGGQDTIVPPAILENYLQVSGDTSCIKHSFVQEAGHEEGWVDKWPDFLTALPSCAHYNAPSDYEPMPESGQRPIFPVSPETPEKP